MQEMWETQVWFLGQEDPQKSNWQPTPVFLPEKIPWREEPEGLQSISLQRVGHSKVTVALATELTHMPAIANTTGTHILYIPFFIALIHFIFSSSTFFTIWKCPVLPPIFQSLKASLCLTSSRKPSLITVLQRNPSLLQIHGTHPMLPSAGI